ncbi:MAG: flavin reductase family protein [Ktedonobacterales bacterium]
MATTRTQHMAEMDADEGANGAASPLRTGRAGGDDTAGGDADSRDTAASQAASQAAFRAVLGRFATGVTVVTTSQEGQPVGITVNAFASLSLDPPLVLACIDRSSYVHDLLQRTGVFAANILAEDQLRLSNCFARRSEERLKGFCGATWHTAATGAPILDGVVGFVDCRVVGVYPGGDHSIFVGQVEALGGTDETPLLYYRAKYTHMETDLDVNVGANPA